MRLSMKNDVTLRRLVISVEPDARNACCYVELKKNEATQQPITIISGVIKKLCKKAYFRVGFFELRKQQ